MTYTGSQAPYTLLVANLDRPSMPDVGVPGHKARTGFRLSFVQSVGLGETMQGGAMVPTSATFGLIDGYADGAPTKPSATLTVVDNTFDGDSAVLFVGPYTRISHVDYTPGGGVAATATALAASISLLPGYSANAVGAVVTVEGPEGALGVQLQFRAIYKGGSANFSFSWPTKLLGLGYLSNSPLLPPEVLP